MAGSPDSDTWSMAPRGSGALRRLSTNSVHAVDKVALLVARIDHHGDQTAPDDVYFWINPALGVAPLTNSAVISILSDTNIYDYSFGTDGTSQPFRDIEMRGEPGTTTWISFVGMRGGETVADPANPYPRGANLAFFEGGTERFAFGNASGSPTNAWSILNGGGAVANLRQSARPFEQLTFMVVRVDHQDGLDNTYLFLNPDLSVEPGISTAAATTLEEFEHTFNRVRPFAGNLDTGNSRPFAVISLDEIRIGTTYQAVTPFTPGGGGEPLKVSIGRSGNQVEVTWTEGTLESALAITGPWSTVQGAAAPSYKLTAEGTQRFFRLRK